MQLFAATPTELGQAFQIEFVSSASNRLIEIANEFYSDIYGVGIYYHDASIDPVFTCFADYDCNAPISATEAPEDLDSTVDVPYGCRSFMVPTGTSVKVYDGNGNSGAFAPVGDFVYIDGLKPINEYGELTCYNS